MAAELAADLEEAEAEGASPRDVLGSGASDPRSFAASWAAERAVIPAPSLTARLRRRSLIELAIAALTIIAATGAALVLFASPSASAPATVIRRLAAPATIAVSKQQAVWVTKADRGVVFTSRQAPGSGVHVHTLGSILLMVGIVGLILSALLLLWSPSRRFDAARP